MILFITDNPYIKKTIPGAILLYQLYNWTVSEDSSDLFNITYNVKNRPKIKFSSTNFQ